VWSLPHSPTQGTLPDPRKRFPPGATADVAETVAFLASSRAGHITGQVIHVNGGAYLGR
jgi:NAD(P)-dependent dehydrogenase (short-subunit alcohol dehydrogenase family)